MSRFEYATNLICLWRNLIIKTVFAYNFCQEGNDMNVSYNSSKEKVFSIFHSVCLAHMFFTPNCVLTNILGQLCDITHPSRTYLKIWRANDLIKERWSKRMNYLWTHFLQRSKSLWNVLAVIQILTKI